MTDIGLSANQLFAMFVIAMIAAAFCGAAIAFGIMERKERMKKSAASKKHTPINLTA